MSEAAERIEKLQGIAVRVGYRKEDLKTTSFDVQTRYENVKDRQGNYKLSLIHIYDVVQLSAAMGTNINLMLIKLNELNRMGWQLNLPYVPHSDFLKDVYKRQVLYCSLLCQSKKLSKGMEDNLLNIHFRKAPANRTVCVSVVDRVNALEVSLSLIHI